MVFRISLGGEIAGVGSQSSSSAAGVFQGVGIGSSMKSTCWLQKFLDSLLVICRGWARGGAERGGGISSSVGCRHEESDT